MSTTTFKRIKDANGPWYEIACDCYARRAYGMCEHLTIVMQSKLKLYGNLVRFVYPAAVGENGLDTEAEATQPEPNQDSEPVEPKQPGRGKA